MDFEDLEIDFDSCLYAGPLDLKGILKIKYKDIDKYVFIEDGKINDENLITGIIKACLANEKNYKDYKIHDNVLKKDQ